MQPSDTIRRRLFPTTFLSIALGLSASAGADGVPLGFRVLGTRIPAQAERVRIPEGWTEEFLATNRTLPTLTEEETRLGYVVFVNNSLEPIYPVTRPVRAEIGGRLDLFSTRGEYEAAGFAIYALTDIHNVTVVAGNLVAQEGYRIASANIDIRTVRCMPRRVWAKPAYVVSPTLLEKRPRIDIDGGTTRQFWVTVFVPPDSQPGQYHGTIRIRVAGRDESSLDVRLKVLPIELMTPPTRHGMYYAPVDTESGPEFKLLPIERVRNDILNMQAHGMNTLFVSIPPYCEAVKDGEHVRFDLEPMRPFVETYVKAGFRDVVYNFCISELIENPLGDFPSMLAAYAAGFKERGWPLTIGSVGDEADANNSLSAVMAKLPLVKKVLPGVATYETIVWPKNSEAFEPHLDIRAFSSYMDETAVEKTRRAGRGLWQYSGTAEYGRNPKGDRLYRGFWASKLGLTGTLQWTYFTSGVDRTQPFNDLIPTAVRNNMTCWVFPGPDGPLPSLGWEAMREGIEDEKYIHTLKELLRQAGTSKIEEVRGTSRQAKQYLEQVFAQIDTSPTQDTKVFPIRRAAEKLPVHSLDQFRRTIAQYIMKLSRKHLAR